MNCHPQNWYDDVYSSVRLWMWVPTDELLLIQSRWIVWWPMCLFQCSLWMLQSPRTYISFNAITLYFTTRLPMRNHHVHVGVYQCMNCLLQNWYDDQSVYSSVRCGCTSQPDYQCVITMFMLALPIYELSSTELVWRPMCLFQCWLWMWAQQMCYVLMQLRCTSQLDYQCVITMFIVDVYQFMN